jgi:predicted secreted protein
MTEATVQALTATLDHPFSVTVIESASTGFLWRVDATSSHELTLVDDGLGLTDEPPPRNEPFVCGGSQARTLQFQAHTLGTHRLRLVQDRPWLQGDPEAVFQDWDVTVS